GHRFAVAQQTKLNFAADRHGADLGTQRGAFVSQVMPGSAAAKAGIKAGDVITSLNGKAISSFAALRAQ
ncbi:PDZ domain-containing protein, partial [Klebsiella quasipneumoniae]|uniref:PDZ domain-containing protein n=1 Tax=Klebsiella quasipneumoniae TaxID=1463165 RepID=UPI002551C190